MRRISSRTTFAFKRAFPIFWFGFLAFVALISIGAMTRAHDFHALILLQFIVMAGGGYLLMKHLVFDLVDEVWDDGDALVIRNGEKDARVVLTNIINVRSTILTNPPRITLVLREPCAFGKEITFSPPTRFLPFSRHPIATELIERIDAKRPRG